jgi:hypothetical protein
MNLVSAGIVMDLGKQGNEIGSFPVKSFVCLQKVKSKADAFGEIECLGIR